jgi:hypothetical protein
MQDLEHDLDHHEEREKLNTLSYRNDEKTSYGNKQSSKSSSQNIPFSKRSNYSKLKLNNSVKSDEEYKYIMMLYNKQLLVNIYLKLKYAIFYDFLV